MKTKKIYLLLIITLILTLFLLINKDVIYQEGNPLTLLKGIIQLNSTKTYVKIKDDPITYVTKTNNKADLFEFIKKYNNVEFKEQMGSAYLFEGAEKNVILTSRQYSRYYQIWKYSVHNIIDLNFSPILTEDLKEVYPNDNLKYEKSISLEDLYNNEKVVINLYSDKILDGSIEPNIIYAFLEYSGKMYDIGYVSNYGLEDLKIESVDISFDGINEIEIVGGLGSTYIEMKLIGYNLETKEFVKLLTMGTPKTIDLDQDGKDELIGVSVGSLPSYVDIYRWNKNRNNFEKAEVAEATKSTFVNLEYINDVWYFVTDSNDENDKYRYFIYNDGKLLER